MSCTVIREVVENVWTFSCPFARFGFIPLGGRSTAIKLKNGGVWILASTCLEPETKAKIQELGVVKYIVSPDTEHYLFLPEYKKAYPEAKLLAPAEVADRLKDLKFDGAWGRDSSNTLYGFEDEIKSCFFSGFKNKDIAFFHVESKVLIEADLLFNLPANEQYSKSRLPRLPFIGGLSPTSWFHPRMIWSLGVNKEAMIKDARTVASWDFDKIIPCHGDVIEADGKKAWESVYRFYLKD